MSRTVRFAVPFFLVLFLISLLAGCGGRSAVPTPAPNAEATSAPAEPGASPCAACGAEPGASPCAACGAEPGANPCAACGAEPGTAEPTQAVGEPTPEAAEPVQDTALSAFLTSDFSGAGICALCHEGLSDQAGADVSLTTDWRSTMMANAARDPLWQAKVSSEVARMPALQATIEAKCVACHMPMAEVQAEVDGAAVLAQGDGFFDPAHPLHEAGMDGVSCTLCHQVADAGLGSKESFSGGYAVDTSTEPPDRHAYGPYEDPFARPMQMHTGFLPVYGAHTGQAELCATCHNLYTPYVDAQGNVLGEFPEQTPYTEWQNSSFAPAMPCQGCHMPVTKGGVVISTMPGALAERKPFYRHHFVGGNALLLGILAEWGGELGVTAGAAHLDATIERVVEQVGKRTATLKAERLELADGVLTASLKVSVLTGHKFPTSFPSRRAWLHVAVADAAGQVIWESGARGAGGSIVGNAADESPAAYEAHYDLITQPDQVQIYEPILADSEGQVTYTLLRAARYLKDNRLLPAGADKAALPADIAVQGEAARDASFVGGSDLVTYRVAVGDAAGPFTLSAELLYEPLSYRFVQDLLADDTPLVERFAGYYTAAGKAPLVVAAIQPATVR